MGIAVLLCECGDEISRLINLKSVKEFIEERENVSLLHLHRHLCDPHTKKRLEQVLLESNPTGVVIGACSPELHLETFQDVLLKAKINPFRLEMVNLREQCSWVHKDSSRATSKANALLNGAIKKVSLSEDVDISETEIIKAVLVIGGGVAGTNAALELSKKGFLTYLIEQEPWIGGMTAKVGFAFPTNDCAYCVGTKSDVSGIRKCFYRAGLPHYPNLKIITNAKVLQVEGSVGNFQVIVEERPTFVGEACISCGMCEEVCPVEVEDEFNRGLTKRRAIYKQFEAIPNKYIIDFENCTLCKKCVERCPEGAIEFRQRAKKHEIRVGAIVVATGIKEFNPSPISRYGYKQYKGVITQLDLARYLDAAGPTCGELLIDGKRPRSIVMIQCVGSRDKNLNPYCSRLCCMMALKHANIIKRRYPDIRVSVCYIDIRTTGIEGYEEWYDEARSLGVFFIPGKPSEVVEGEDGALRVRTEDIMLGEEVELEADLVVLSAGIESSEGTKEVAALLSLDLNKDGFIQVLDPKVRTLDTKRWGVFVCGGARGATDIPESIIQAHAVAGRVGTLFAKEKIVDRRYYPRVDTKECKGCEVCMVKCPFGAAKLIEEEDGALRCEINRDVCRGCGICAAACPNGAVQLIGFTDQQIFAQLEGMLEVPGIQEKVIGFICKECGYASSDLAGVERFTYPEEVHLLSVPCLGRVSSIHILKAFERGAKGVVLVGCMPERCQYSSGDNVRDNLLLAKEVLQKIGAERRVELFNLCGAASHEFAKNMNEFVERISR